jgi:hypothetical protein
MSFIEKELLAEKIRCMARRLAFIK